MKCEYHHCNSEVDCILTLGHVKTAFCIVHGTLIYNFLRSKLAYKKRVYANENGGMSIYVDTT